jgi:hypothetical protein
MSDERTFIHDLMTPLSVAQAYTGMVRKALDGEVDKLDLVDLRRRLDRCCAALEKLMTLATERRATLLHEPD